MLNADNCIAGFVIGPAKSGTTLMISLLDNHPELSIIPLEVKFYEHYHHSLKSTDSYELMNKFFLGTKLRFLNLRNFAEDHIMASGRIDFSKFNFDRFKELMDDKAKNYKPHGKPPLARYIIDLHNIYTDTLGHPEKNGFAIKEGNHGLPYIDFAKHDFKNAKFIVMVRDPRDMFSSFKSIERLIQAGRNYAGFSNLCLFRYLFRTFQRDRLPLAFMDYFKNIGPGEDMLFVRYEELVRNTEKEMAKVADFLGISFCESMLKPTTAGNIWGGNASSGEKFKNVVKSRVGKWEKDLDKEEILLLEYFMGDYLKKFGYKKTNNKISKLDCILSIRFSHFGRVTILEGDILRSAVAIAKYIVNSIIKMLLMLKRLFARGEKYKSHKICLNKKINIGCVFKEGYNKAANNKEAVFSRIKGFKKGNKTATFYDSSLGNARFTEDFYIEYIELIREFCEMNRDVNVLLKPKKSQRHVEAYIAGRSHDKLIRYMDVWKQLFSCDNFNYLDPAEWTIEETIAVSDVCVTMGLTTPSTIALVCGKNAFYFDNSDNTGHSFAQKYKDKIVFDNKDFLLKQISNVLSGEFDCRDLISEREIREYDAFNDDKALERLRNDVYELTKGCV